MRQLLSPNFAVLVVVFLFENGTPGHAQILCGKDCDGLCNRTVIDAGHGYSRYPKDCTKFVQCWKEGTITRTKLHTCPFGQFWDADAVSCKLSYLARCDTDPCKNSPAGITYGAKEYGCRAYWKCTDNLSFHHCCPKGSRFVGGVGSRFVGGVGCVNDVRCTDGCPPGEEMGDQRGMTIESICGRKAFDVGQSFSPHPEDCTKFVQCWTVGNIISSGVRTCPFGQFWDSAVDSCRLSSLVRCTSDPCNSYTPGFTYGAMEYGCRAYWKCADNISIHHCCANGYAFVDGIGCVNNAACTDECQSGEGIVVKSKMAGKPMCGKRKHFDKHFYIETVPPGMDDVIRLCPPGSIFFEERCLCDFETSH